MAWMQDIVLVIFLRNEFLNVVLSHLSSNVQEFVRDSRH